MRIVHTETIVWCQQTVTTTLKPAAGSTDASSRADASNYDPIVLLRRFVRLKPLNTGSKGEHWCRDGCLVSGMLALSSLRLSDTNRCRT